MPAGIVIAPSFGSASHALGTVSFGADASVYLRPIGASAGLYDYGYASVPAGARSHTFTTSGQLQASERPHISIHESGECHVRSGRGRSSMALGESIGRLNRFTGQHVASIFTSSPSSLARLDDVWPDPGAPDEHAEIWRLPTPSRAGSLRVAVYVSRRPIRPRGGSLGHRHFQLRRHDGGSLFIAVEVWAAQNELGTATVGAIGGWRPESADDVQAASRFVFVRAA
jgi:hypothetical protein